MACLRSRSSCDLLTKWRSPIAISISKKRSRSTIKRSTISHALSLSQFELTLVTDFDVVLDNDPDRDPYACPDPYPDLYLGTGISYPDYPDQQSFAPVIYDPQAPSVSASFPVFRPFSFSSFSCASWTFSPDLDHCRQVFRHLKRSDGGLRPRLDLDCHSNHHHLLGSVGPKIKW